MWKQNQTKCSLFSIQGNFSVNRKDLQASTLVGLTLDKSVADHLAVLHLDNPQYIFDLIILHFAVSGIWDQEISGYI